MPSLLEAISGKPRRTFAALSVLALIVITSASEASAAGESDRLLREASLWDDPGFLEQWVPRSSPSRLSHRVLRMRAEFFGHRPHGITGLFDGDRLESISILFLDSGTFYGFRLGGFQGEQAHAIEERFDEAFATVVRDVTAGLRDLAGREGEAFVLAREPLLRREVVLFPLGDLTGRLLTAEGHLVKLTLFRSADAARSSLDLATAALGKAALADFLLHRVTRAANGDVQLRDVPIFPQGDRAYCGVSTLAMAMQYLGLRFETEEYAAAAGIRYGSARGARIKEIYLAAAEEAGTPFARSSEFEFDRAKTAIDAGLPVVVWRYFTSERNYVHEMTHRRRLRGDADVTLPEPDDLDRSTWPTEEFSLGNHASLITGYNEQTRELIFSESWGEYARDRRMRIEEMEGTAYYAFYPHL